MVSEFDNDSADFEEKSIVQPTAPARPDPKAAVEKKEFSLDGITPSPKKARSPSQKKLESELDPDDLSGGFSNSISFADMGVKDAFTDYTENDFVDDLNYNRPKNHNAPEPRPGFDQRFCQLEVNGKRDHKGIAKMQANKWRVRQFTKAEVHGFPAVMVKEKAGVYVIMGSKGGSFLCERPQEISENIRRRNLHQANLQGQATKRNFHEEASKGNVNVTYDDTTVVKRGFKPVVAPNTGR